MNLIIQAKLQKLKRNASVALFASIVFSWHQNLIWANTTHETISAKPADKCLELFNRAQETRQFRTDYQTQIQEAIQSSKFNPDLESVVIVNAYSSARYLAQEFRQAGVQVIHIHSDGVPTKEYYKRLFNPADFNVDLAFWGDFQSLVDALLKVSKIRAVFKGADSGVLFGDRLSFALNQAGFHWVPTDGVDVAKKEKFLQAVRLKENGLDYIKQIITDNEQHAIQWIHQNRLFLDGPRAIVIKPNSGAGSQGVHLCHTEKEVREAFYNLLKVPNEQGLVEKEVLVQEFLPGNIEYAVNATSLNGHFVFTDIWKYDKRVSRDSKAIIYGADILMPYHGEVQKTLVDYASKVMHALGALNGNVHIEIKIVEGRGPVLIEHNDRMMGSFFPLLVKQVLGHGQLDRSVLSVLNPHEFMLTAPGYEMKKYPAHYSLAVLKPGQTIRPQAESLIRALPGFHSLNFVKKPGEELSETIDLATSWGSIQLIANSEEELAQSLDKIKELERNGSLTGTYRKKYSK